MPCKIKSKRTMMLLEVMIAFALVALCLLPLVSSNVGIYKAQKEFEREVVLDHAVNLLYADVLEKLYLNKISWNDLLVNTFPIEEAMAARAGINPVQFPFTGTYKFTLNKTKPKQPAPYSAWLLDLKFSFLLKNNVRASPIEYTYQVFIVRDLRTP